MPQDFGFKVVTLDEGDGPVKAIKDASGRIVTADQVDAMRQKQEADLAQATDLHDKLAAGDPAATAQIVSQVKDNLTRQLAMLDKQKADMTATLAKLEAGDQAATADAVQRMTDQLSRRASLFAAARDRSVQMLTEVAPAGVGVVVTPVTPVPAVKVTPATSDTSATPATPAPASVG